MQRENFAQLGATSFDIKMEAVRLMSEALLHPKDADNLIELANDLFDYAATLRSRRG